MKLKVIFVDDEQFKVGKWKRRLAIDYEVIPIDSADDTIQYFETNYDVMAMVLDFMMPQPTGVADSATENTLSTGAYILRVLKEKIIKLPCPVLVLTNKEKPLVVAAVEEINFPKGLVTICLKGETSDDDLAILAGQMIARWCKLK